MKVGIAGGGLLGRLLAWRLAKAGNTVEIFDLGIAQRCAQIAAGLLGPFVELSKAAEIVHHKGVESIKLWSSWLGEINAQELLTKKGTILVAPDRDHAELERVTTIIKEKVPNQLDKIKKLNQDELIKLEPALNNFAYGYYLIDEAHIYVDKVLDTIFNETKNLGVTWHENISVKQVDPKKIIVNDATHEFDWACDCRGLGANDELPLRGIRGECVHLYCEQIDLQRPVFVIHPQHPIYIVPYKKNHFIIGATEVETNNLAPITVRSALELLGAAFSFNPYFSEANIIDTRVGLRPAKADNQPFLNHEEGKIAINGMYRHGYLNGPAFVNDAIKLMQSS